MFPINVYSIFTLTFCAIFISCAPSTDEDAAEVYLKDVNDRLATALNKLTIAEWNYATNISKETEAERVWKEFLISTFINR